MQSIYFSLALASLGIIWAASRLAVYADAIATRFNLSRSWIGLLFVSIVTTLPEGAVTIGALTHVGSPDLAVSNVFGSVLFNLTILAWVDLWFRCGGILRLSQAHNVLPVACAMIMLLWILGTLLFPLPLSFGPFHVGAGALLAPVIFAGLLFFMQKKEASNVLPGVGQSIPETQHPLVGFFVCAGIVIVCAITLAHLGDQAAEHLGLRHSFVGFILLAVITSLPELTFGIAAVRIGKYDLLLGNIMGANMINALVIAFADMVYFREILHAPQNIGMEQIFAGMLALLASALILTGIVRRRETKRRRVIGTVSGLLFLIYVFSLAAMYFGIDV